MATALKDSGDKTNSSMTSSNTESGVDGPDTRPDRWFLPGRMIAILLIHAAALTVFIPWVFTWTGLITGLVTWHIFGMFGITIGYHRMLTHQGFTCPKWFERTLVTLGVCCLQGPPARWVGTHRAHHKFSDDEADPHTPSRSFFWSHMGWLFFDVKGYTPTEVCAKYAPDLMRRRFYSWLERGWNAELIYVIHAIAFWLAGFGLAWAISGNVLTGLQIGTSVLVWAVVLRTVWVWHITWSVNSLTHVFGYQNFESSDNSRNNWLVALLAHGEGWHNNHHADQRCAKAGHRWWEFDLSFLMIRIMKRLGLAKDIKLRRLDKSSDADLIPGTADQAAVPPGES